MRFVENYINFSHFGGYYLKLQRKKACLYDKSLIMYAQ